MEQKQKAALFIDGQNMLPFNYNEMHNAVKKYDTIVKRVYLTERDIGFYRGNGKDIVASLENSGFEVILSGHLKNIDSYLIPDAMEFICERKDIKVIALASGDGDFTRVIEKAKLRGRYTILITEKNQKNISAALQSLVHEQIKVPSLNNVNIK